MRLSKPMQAMSDALTECARGNASGQYWDRHIVARGQQLRTARALESRTY